MAPTPNFHNQTMDEDPALSKMGDYGAITNHDSSTETSGLLKLHQENNLKKQQQQQQQDEGKPKILIHTPSHFIEDARNFREGSVPHSIVIAGFIGVIVGICAWLYYTILEALLEFIWKTLSEKYVVDVWPEWSYFLYIPLVGFGMAFLVGVSVKYMGDPGDLNFVVKCVHEKAYISIHHTLPMIAASQFTIIGGGSLGPEAPLVAISAAVSGVISRSIFHNSNRNVVRKHTLMGMAGALAAFFGCPLGGSLFALEVTSRLGLEYFEHAVESIFCGEVTLAVFRSLSGLPIGPIWKISDSVLLEARPYEVFLGIFVGLIGAAIAFGFASLHKVVMGIFRKLNWLRDETAIQRALLGACFVVLMGVLVPHTMFWGENEFQTISTISPASTLPHIWPTTGATNWELNSFWTCFFTGVAKIIAISWTVAGGYRGGFIFPLFSAGAAFGRALSFLLPIFPVQLTTLGMAAGINVSITRTPLATTLILCYLSGEPSALSGVLASSLTALFATSYMPFLKAQVPRSDLDQSTYVNDDAPQIEPDTHDHDDGHHQQQQETKKVIVVDETPLLSATKEAEDHDDGHHQQQETKKVIVVDETPLLLATKEADIPAVQRNYSQEEGEV